MIIGFKNAAILQDKIKEAMRFWYQNPNFFWITEDEEDFKPYPDVFALKKDFYLRDDLTVYLDDKICGDSIKQFVDTMLMRFHLDWYIVKDHVYPQVYLDRRAREYAERKKQEQEWLATHPTRDDDNVVDIADYLPLEAFDDGHFEDEMREFFGDDWENRLN